MVRGIRKGGVLIMLMSFTWFLNGCKNEERAKESRTELQEREEEEDDMEQIMKQEFYMVKDPAVGYVPSERLIPATAYMNRIFAISRTAELKWQERGPNQIAGRTRALLIDKRDATGNTIYAGGVGGGIWKCTNFKTTPVWTPVNDKLPNLAVTCLAQDPSNTNVIYAGTGEGWFNADAIRGNGIIKTSDGGASWNFLTSTDTSTNNFDFLQDIVVTATGVVYATTRSFRFCNSGGVLKSINGGASWIRVIGTLAAGATSCNQAFNFRGADLEIASNGDLYATTGIGSSDTSNQGRIFKSPASLGATQGNAGTWTDITPAGKWKRIELAVAPNNPNVLYALLEISGENSAIGGIRRSDDGGGTWVTLPLPTWCDQGTTSTDFTRTQAFFNLIAAVDPNNSSVCYIGGVDILKTADKGLTWTQVTQWSSGCSGLPQIHADIHNILFNNSSSSEVLASTDGGVFYSPNAGTSWVNKNNGYRITQFYSVDFHPTLADYFLAGAQDNGTQKFTSPGINTTISTPLGGDGSFAHIDQTDGQIQVYAFNGNNYRYSRNGGATFTTVSGGSSSTGRFINPTDYDDPKDVLYTGHDPDKYGLVLGLPGTATPTFNEVPLTALSGRQISAVKVDQNIATGGVVWFAGSTAKDATTSVAPVLVKLSNANTITPTVDKTVTLPLSVGSYISSIDVESGNSNHMLLTASNYGVVSVWESTDGGTTWASIEGNLPDMPVRWGIFAPANTQLSGTTAGNGGIILATELGVWTTSLSSGAGTVWIPNNTDFVNTRVDMVKYRSTDNLLAAATHGRGLFTTIIPGVTITPVDPVNPVVNPSGFIQYISANRQQLFVRTGSSTSVTAITINIFDLAGRLVYSNKTGYANATIPLTNLATGIYIVRIYGDNKEVFTQRFFK
ncbi:MAG: T9SS type A sorting domain-containing protein [Segetibacter sp.]|nr:T9SS type A sorting domain-containing protein [Segetibacter sp.]